MPFVMEQQLQNLLREGARHVQTAIGRPPRRLLQSIGEVGAIETVRGLLDAPWPSETFADLWPNHQELTVEAIALRPEFQHLFTAEQLETARRRLGRS